MVDGMRGREGVMRLLVLRRLAVGILHRRKSVLLVMATVDVRMRRVLLVLMLGMTMYRGQGGGRLRRGMFCESGRE